MGVAEGEKETFSIVDTATEIDGKTRKRVKRQRINERRIYTRSSSLEMQHVVNNKEAEKTRREQGRWEKRTRKRVIRQKKDETEKYHMCE